MQQNAAAVVHGTRSSSAQKLLPAAASNVSRGSKAMTARSPSPARKRKPAWVSAEWKHVVPEPQPQGSSSSSPVGTGNAFLREQRQRQLVAGR